MVWQIQKRIKTKWGLRCKIFSHDNVLNTKIISAWWLRVNSKFTGKFTGKKYQSIKLTWEISDIREGRRTWGGGSRLQKSTLQKIRVFSKKRKVVTFGAEPP